MWMLSIWLSIAQAVSGAGQSDPTPVAVVGEGEVRFDDAIGDCDAGSRSINLRRLLFLADREVEIDGPHGPILVSVEGEYLYIYRAGQTPREALFGTNIGSEAEPRRNLDIELRLAVFDGRLVVYWKETFQHRIYEQGIYRIDGEEITFLCKGRGGVTTSD
jgi:hypothetical protein